MGFAMAIVAPKGRKHLSADALFRLVRSGFANIADDGPDDVDISLTETDVLMSALAMFSLQSPSLLAFEQQRAEGNVHTIYGIERVLCDTYRRERLDMVSPKSLRSVCTHLFRQLQCGQALEERMFFDGYLSLGTCWHGVFFFHDHALCILLAKSPPQWGDHVLSSDVGRSAHPSRRAYRDSMDAGTDREAGWDGQKRW